LNERVYLNYDENLSVEEKETMSEYEQYFDFSDPKFQLLYPKELLY